MPTTDSSTITIIGYAVIVYIAWIAAQVEACSLM